MTRHVLLLNSDKPEVLRALAARPDLRIRVITREAYAGLYADHETAFVDSFEDLTQVERAAHRLARGGPFDHVVAATEKSVVAAGLIRSLLDVPGQTFDQSLWAAHKRAMKQRLRSFDLPVTDFAQVATVDDVPRAAEAVGWPVMVKPVFGAASRSTHRVDSAADFAALHRAGAFAGLARRGQPVQVERLVRHRGEYHCDGVVRGGRVALAAVSRYFTPPFRTPSELNSSWLVDQDAPAAREMLALHERVARALELRDGVTHLEIFATDEGPVIGEVAVRPGGLGISRTWWHAFGVDLWEEFVRAALDEPSDPRARPQDRTLGRIHLPGREDVRERAAALPGVIEALPPAATGTPNVEVHFAAPDPAAVERLHARLCALAEAPA